MATLKIKTLSAALIGALVSFSAAHATDAVDAAATSQDTRPDSSSSSSSSSSSDSSGITTEFSGFIRSDTAISTTNQTDPFNLNGNKFNGVSTSLAPIPLTVTRDGKTDSQALNLQQFRAELSSTTHFGSDFSLVARLRAIFDPGWYNEYDPNDVNSHAVGYTYGDPNYFKYHTPGNARPNPLEVAGQNYMIDLPALFLEYNHGPLDLRLGNQQIAWGQSLFFRVLDVPDGLDFRRHSILDYASEEYSDKRVPALGLRATYQFNDNWLFDGYIQKFQPTIYGNTNTAYQIIPAEFTIRDDYADYDNKFDEGFRIKGSVGNLGVQGMFVHRYNPDGVFAWSQSGVNRDITALGAGSGGALQCTPFEGDPTGVWSANEWFYYAAQARLNGITGLESAVNQFPCSQGLTGGPVPGLNFGQATGLLNTFFAASPLRGWLSREYKEENDIGGGLTYTLSGAPGSFTDQMIINWEVMYTPNRTFTAPSLSNEYIRTNEWTTAVTLEKYQRFSESLPATYMVAGFEYKSKSDLFGRYLGGYGGTEFSAPTGISGGWKAVSLAIQQPFPNLIWRFDFAMLYDLQGGVLIQPGVRWKPSGNFTVEAFYNYINSHLGGNPNQNLFGGLDYAKELSFRVGYQF